MKTLRLWLVGVLATLCVAGAARAQAASMEPRVDGFDVEEVSQLDAGTALHFTLYGTPGASATLRIDGAARELVLQEGQAGIYEGTYTIDAADGIAPDSHVTAQLVSDGRVVRAALEEPLVLGASAAAPCPDCGVVQSIRAVQVRGDEPGYGGMVVGGVAGAILGSQVGHGDGRTLARILGALGGAYAGREIERASRRHTRYDVAVHMDDGSTQTHSMEGVPPWRVGDRVRLAQGRLLRDAEVDPR